MGTPTSDELLTEEAHLSGPMFREIERISEAHGCSLSSLVSSFILFQLSRVPSYSGLSSKIPELIGAEFEKCRHALASAGLAFGPRVAPAKKSEQFVPTPLEPFASAWRESTGEVLGGPYITRLSAQICSKYGTQAVRTPTLACSMFRCLFPAASFFVFANDVHRFSQTMDSASTVWERVTPEEVPFARKKWSEVWACAKENYPGQYTADDPYLFVPSVTPRFSLADFKKLAGTVELRDALALAAAPVAKRTPPSARALTGLRRMP